MDSKLGLRFISKMNQQIEYLIANSIESVKRTKQIVVSRLSEYFLFAFDFSNYFQTIKSFVLRFLSNWLNGFYF